METKYLNVPFEIKETKEDADHFFYEGYASTFGNIDLGDDMCMPGCFAETIKDLSKKKNKIKNTDMDSILPALWQHTMYEPIGAYIELKEDAKGLFVVGALPKKDTFVSGRVIPQLEIGSIKAMSIGYRVKEFFYNTETEIRELIKLSLKEISLVTFPMNEEATITGLKNATRIDDLSKINIRDFERLLINGVSMGSKNAKIITSMVKECLLRDEKGEVDRDGDRINWNEVATAIKNIKLEK